MEAHGSTEMKTTTMHDAMVVILEYRDNHYCRLHSHLLCNRGLKLHLLQEVLLQKRRPVCCPRWLHYQNNLVQFHRRDGQHLSGNQY